jgi:predicted nucleic acid-binding protein
MKPHFVLDAWAVLALLQGEDPAAARVKELLELALNGEARISMSIINLGEVIYRVGKVKGEEQATRTLEETRRLPLTIVSASDEAVFAAVSIRMNHAISYADEFSAATAQDLGAVLVTGDPELLELDGVIAVERLHREARGE